MLKGRVENKDAKEDKGALDALLIARGHAIRTERETYDQFLLARNARIVLDEKIEDATPELRRLGAIK